MPFRRDAEKTHAMNCVECGQAIPSDRSSCLNCGAIVASIPRTDRSRLRSVWLKIFVRVAIGTLSAMILAALTGRQAPILPLGLRLPLRASSIVSEAVQRAGRDAR